MTQRENTKRRWRAGAVATVAAVTVSVVATQVWEADAASTGSAYVPVSPCRLLDTRPGANNVGARSQPLDTAAVTLQVTGNVGNCSGASAIPADAVAVALNVTIVRPTATSNLRLYPADVSTVPTVSNLNWTAESGAVANKADIKLSSAGQLKIKNAAGQVDVIIDAMGYYSESAISAGAGVPGPQGPQGPAGPPGRDGDPGTGDSAFQIWLDAYFAAEPQHDGSPIDGSIDVDGFFEYLSAYGIWSRLEDDQGNLINDGESFEDFISEVNYYFWLAERNRRDNATSRTLYLEFIEGKAGPSAFEVWQAQTGNSNKTEQQFFDELTGADGEDGASAYEVWRSLNGNGNKSEQDFIDELTGTDGVDGEDGQDGASAFEVWRSLNGNGNKSEQDFIAELTGTDGQDGAPGAPGADGADGAPGADGADGADGQSAYELWKANGNTGPDTTTNTETDFLNWLSAWGVWERQAGNGGGSEADFLDWLQNP